MKKKCMLVLTVFMACCLSACSSVNTEKESETAESAYTEYVETESAETFLSEESSEEETNGEEEITEMDAANRTMIAEALGIEENSRNIRFILNSLNTIGAGQLQSAEASETDGEKVISIVAEDGTKYCIYLTGSGSVDAVKNLDTDEWPIQSAR